MQIYYVIIHLKKFNICIGLVFLLLQSLAMIPLAFKFLVAFHRKSFERMLLDRAMNASLTKVGR